MIIFLLFWLGVALWLLPVLIECWLEGKDPLEEDDNWIDDWR